jgi:cell division transport system permease protein
MRVSISNAPFSLKTLFTQILYLCQETSRGLRRGGWMNWAAISTVTVLLFLLGISLQTSWQVSGLLQQAGSQMEISVYLKPEFTGDVLKTKIEQFPDVSSVEIISKDAAWKDLMTDLGAAELQGATDALSQNPLVDQLKVRAVSVNEVSRLAEMLANFTEVESVAFLNEALKNLLQLNQGITQISTIVLGLLALTALAVINTTIRLIVVARHQEIEVMHLVGATNTWIYLPFLFQGILFGVVGAGVSWGFIEGTRYFVHRLLVEQPNFLQSLMQGLQLTTTQNVLLPVVLFGAGGCVGLMGSFLAVRRFLLVK